MLAMLVLLVVVVGGVNLFPIIFVKLICSFNRSISNDFDSSSFVFKDFPIFSPTDEVLAALHRPHSLEDTHSHQARNQSKSLVVLGN